MKEIVKSDSARHAIAFQETMKRLHGEIERMVYAAEIACKDASGDDFRCPLGSECPFHAAHKPNRPYGCMVAGFRDILGDHFDQHDCMVMDANAPKDDKGQSEFRRECPR